VLLGLPFVIAGVLTLLMLASDRLHWHGERIAGYGFLFGTPWAWLLDRGWIPNPHNRFLGELFGFLVILWIPAALYSTCLWLLLTVIRKWASRRSSQGEGRSLRANLFVAEGDEGVDLGGAAGWEIGGGQGD